MPHKYDTSVDVTLGYTSDPLPVTMRTVCIGMGYKGFKIQRGPSFHEPWHEFYATNSDGYIPWSEFSQHWANCILADCGAFSLSRHSP